MKQRGFTLIEIMVAVLISAILSVMAFEAMQNALTSRERIQSNATRLRDVQFAMRSVVQDFSQLVPRPVREPLGATFQAALLGTRNTDSAVALTRGGWMNPVGGERSNFQRVRYQLRDKKLYRGYWLALDAPLDPPPQERVLLDQVKSFSVRYMAVGRNWLETWPPPTAGGAITERELRERPLAVEVTIELEDWGKLIRLVEVPG
jgi:general secretion pathway protein J